MVLHATGIIKRHISTPNSCSSCHLRWWHHQRHCREAPASPGTPACGRPGNQGSGGSISIQLVAAFHGSLALSASERRAVHTVHTTQRISANSSCIAYQGKSCLFLDSKPLDMVVLYINSVHIGDFGVKSHGLLLRLPGASMERWLELPLGTSWR